VVNAVLDRIVVLVALAMLSMGSAACGTTTVQGAAPTEVAPPRATPFEAWSAGNGTGAFFGAVGPAGGSGVKSGWPQ
jgi:hypothetical protein